MEEIEKGNGLSWGDVSPRRRSLSFFFHLLLRGEGFSGWSTETPGSVASYDLHNTQKHTHVYIFTHTHIERPRRTRTDTLKQTAEIKPVWSCRDDLIKYFNDTHWVKLACIAPAQATAGNTHGNKRHPSHICTHIYTLTSHNFICVAAMLGQRNVWAGAPCGEEAANTHHNGYVSCCLYWNTVCFVFEGQDYSSDDSGWWVMQWRFSWFFFTQAEGQNWIW